MTMTRGGPAAENGSILSGDTVHLAGGHKSLSSMSRSLFGAKIHKKSLKYVFSRLNIASLMFQSVVLSKRPPTSWMFGMYM